MNRYLVAFVLFFLLSSDKIWAQLVKYAPNGQRIRVNSEKISMYIDHNKDKSTMSGVSPLSLPNILTSFITGGMSVAKAFVAKQQQKYSASFTISKTDKGLLYLTKPGQTSSAQLDISTITIDRTTDILDTAMHVVLVVQPEPQSGLFRMYVSDIYEPFTKAKIKRIGKLGKSIDLSIDIKIDAIWKEAASPNDDKSTSFNLKAGNLGESTISIPNIIPGKRYHFKKENAEYLSSWYQTIPFPSLKFADSTSDWQTGWYTITIGVKEANPYAFNSQQLSDFLNSSGADLSTFLKQFIPTNGK